MTETPALIDRSGGRYPLDARRWRGDDGSPLMVTELPGITREQIDSSLNSQWRYAAALPLKVEPVSLGEGRTPLLSRQLAGREVLLKAETNNPTASFKDRGTSAMISVLRTQGIEAILEDSSGNGGSSVAAYAAAAGIAAQILAPESTSPSKILQSRVHGASVELIPGNRQNTADEAMRRCAERYYASHNWHPFFLQGIKLIAYEIWEDLGFRAPAALLMPAGAGSLVLGCWMGFSELLHAGEISRLPRLLVAQPAQCSPLVRAFHADAETVEPAEWGKTLAEGTAIARPVRDREVLRAVRETRGAVTAVPEDALRPATRQLARTGVYAEPTSAQVLPALEQFIDQGDLKLDEDVVAILTGSGLKAAASMEKLVES